GGGNKLGAEGAGKPMVRHAGEAARASTAAAAIVVAGHQAKRVREALEGCDATVVENRHYAQGLSTSLKRGIAAAGEIDPPVDGAVVLLGDMPTVSPGDLDRLIAAFDPEEGRAICAPTFNGKRGNPVLWGREFFDDMAGLTGDVGAKHLIGENADRVCDVPMATQSVLTDVDTPEALAALEKAKAG
ncbi:MAG: nucleotidyltransferase family protein, partial [Acetobacterales bacterium]